MAGNTFGNVFKITTFGESHGIALGAIIDGCPAGLLITEKEIQKELDRRKPGTSGLVTQRKESDKVQILSGIFDGKTTGTPIGLLIYNEDQKSKDYSDIKDSFRPGHADITYQKKYGIRDYRGGGRSSARETAMRVAAGAIAKKLLKENFCIDIYAFVSQVGVKKVAFDSKESINKNPLFIANLNEVDNITKYLKSIRKEGNSIGAKVELVIKGIPAGLGEPVFDRIDAELAKALMSINAAKAVEIGAGIHSVTQKGNEHRDEITPNGFLSNNAGGILGGISTGQNIEASVSFKPTPSILIKGKTINKDNGVCEIITKGRHDPCVGIRAVPIVEAMAAVTIVDFIYRKKDSLI